ncbi:hypothetical protein AOE58_02405 [Candidatus Riesia pthiripubis]|uniref:Malonyl-[acyl-carrier protein] O-methyltransferase BioC n=1 Tax=Candidatus Riesia pthiripubis TaxID=428412 RepID=A0A1V0HPA2_9ENTR|nr:hypothetical protein AOE58_02405 [Candidatus Riesia pthiripubis]
MRELKQCWKNIDDNKHINSFYTIDDIKKACKKWRFTLKKKSWNFLYPSFNCLIRSIKGIGANYLLPGKTKHGLMTKNYLFKLIDNYPNLGDKFPITYKVVYGILYRE